MEQYDKMTTGNLIDAARREAVELDWHRATTAEKRLSGLLDALADRLESDIGDNPPAPAGSMPEVSTLADLMERHAELKSAAYGCDRPNLFFVRLYEENHRRIVEALRKSGPVRLGRLSWTLIDDPERPVTELGRAGDQPSADEFDATGRRKEEGCDQTTR